MLRVDDAHPVLTERLLGAIDRGVDYAAGFRWLGRYLMPQLRVTGLAQPITPAELSGQSQFIDENGDLRTHPAKAIGPASGLDGFFAARLVRS